MPAWGRHNGVWRDTWANYTRVNGVWRANSNYVRVNGVMRQVYKYDIDEDDLIGFRLVYTLDKERVHPKFPHLKYNPNLPVKIDITGDTIGGLSVDRKGVVYEYFREHPEIEGTKFYVGTLYAIISDGYLINLATVTENIGEEWQYTANIPGGEIAWHSARPRNLCVDIALELRYEDYGYFIGGYNHFMGTDDVMDNYGAPPPHDANREVITYEPFSVLPIHKRPETFNGDIAIGIARDNNSKYANMLGNHGILDQTIHRIMVNGLRKPFIIEVYDE